jgi:hypothetical protein
MWLVDTGWVMVFRYEISILKSIEEKGSERHWR